MFTAGRRFEDFSKPSVKASKHFPRFANNVLRHGIFDIVYKIMCSLLICNQQFDYLCKARASVYQWVRESKDF